MLHASGASVLDPVMRPPVACSRLWPSTHLRLALCGQSPCSQPKHIIWSDGSPASKKQRKPHANTGKAAAESSRRFDFKLDHSHILRTELGKNSKGTCQYCGVRNTAVFECRTCGVALHYPSKLYNWPCAANYHLAEKKCLCWADHSAAEKKSFSADADVAVVQAQVAANTSKKPVVSPTAGGGRQVVQIVKTVHTKPATRGKAKGRGTKKKQ